MQCTKHLVYLEACLSILLQKKTFSGGLTMIFFFFVEKQHLLQFYF